MDEDVQGLRLAVQVCFDRGPLCRVPTRAKSGGNLLSLPAGMQANLRFLGTAFGMAGSGVLARINHDIETMLLPVTRAIIGLSGNRDWPSRTRILVKTVGCRALWTAAAGDAIRSGSRRDRRIMCPGSDLVR